MRIEIFLKNKNENQAEWQGRNSLLVRASRCGEQRASAVEGSVKEGMTPSTTRLTSSSVSCTAKEVGNRYAEGKIGSGVG